LSKRTCRIKCGNDKANAAQPVPAVGTTCSPALRASLLAEGIVMAGRRPVAKQSGAMKAKAGTMKSPTCRMAGTAQKTKNKRMS